MTFYYKTFFYLLVIFLPHRSQCFAQIIAETTVADSSVIHLADPTIFSYKGMYYLYGTVEGAAGNGFLVYTSTDLKKC